MGAACRHLDQLAAAGGDLVPRLLPSRDRGRRAGDRRDRDARAGARQRAQRQLRAHRARQLRAAGARLSTGALSTTSDQRVLDPRPRAGVRPAPAPGPGRDGDRRLGLQRVGRQVSAVGRRRRRADAGRRRARPAGLPRRHRDGRAAPSTSTAPAPCSPRRRACCNKNRNRGLPKAEVEQYLKDYYGQRHVVWLGEGIAGDDTDGHVDDLARFIDARDDRHGRGRRPARRQLPRARATTAGGSTGRATPTAGRSRSSSCRCRGRSCSRASGCRRPT